MHEEIKKFLQEKEERIASLGKDEHLKKLGAQFVVDSASKKYPYNFTWMDRPIIALPQDMIAMQELIWKIKPDLIIEAGIAHGGSLVYYASLLELIGEDGVVLGIDIDIRSHNRAELEHHPMFKRIKMIEGSSVDSHVIDQVKTIAQQAKRVMVCLDSLHTYEHVLKELHAYSPLVTKGSYLIAFDTIIEQMPDSLWTGKRPWGKGNNPATAVTEFLSNNTTFVVDRTIENKLLITSCPGGYLQRVQ